jgi:hypothetical protein
LLKEKPYVKAFKEKIMLCKKIFAIVIIVLIVALPSKAQDLLVVFASNLENAGGVNHLDVSGADLYSVRFNPAAKTVSNLQRLTAANDATEFFPSLSPDSQWMAYNYHTVSSRRISTTPTTNGVVYVTLAMHNEDNFPANQQAYLISRNNLIEFCKMLQRHQVAFNWESDWKFLLGVLQWDTPDVTAATGGKNIVRYLKEDLGISVDPHSHENQGYNYADVAHLIDSLGVNPTNVVGGHIWDPTERLYQDWERFKQPLKGNKFPWAQWKGDILMGSATGLHRNDPEPSGVWRPKGKYEFWIDDPAGNVHAVGQHQGSFAGIQALANLYKTGAIAPDKILTATIVIGQTSLNSQYTANYETTTIKPLLEMQNRGEIKIVTFHQLLEEWKTIYHAVGHVYLPGTTSINEGIGQTAAAPANFSLAQNYPNPFNPATTIYFSLPQRQAVSLRVFNAIGQEVKSLVNGVMEAGDYKVIFEAASLPSGVYFYQIKTASFWQTRKAVLMR